jgi:hypothetical protein
MKNYSIWIEGYAVTGEHSPAQFIGVAGGETFEDACKNFRYEDTGEPLSLDENRDYPAIWACRLFDNEADARKGFG